MAISNFTSCAEELSIHLQDFDNWKRPVIPPVQNCPETVFDPDYFVDASTGSNWICLNNGSNIDDLQPLFTILAC